MSGEDHGLVHWTKRLFFATAALAVVTTLSVLAAVGAFSSSSSTTSSSGSSSSNSQSSSNSGSATASPTRFHAVYLDTLPDTSGASQATPGLVGISGRTYQHGIQMTVGWAEPTAQASYAIPRGARTFSARIGNDDANPQGVPGASIPLLYEVFADDRRVAMGNATGRIHDPPLTADVTGAGTIKLMITNVGDAYGSTKADWANPVFH